MPVIVGVELRKTKEVFKFIPGSLDINVGDRCVVETENGLELGKVVFPERMIEKTRERLFRVVRKLTPADFRKIEENGRRNREAFNKVIEKVKQRELDMKLTCVDYTFDRNKLFVYYTAEGRIDFRELIKDLGYILKTRIQMVQIGVRDEAKMLGGYGRCGCELCCCSFLRDFNPISIDMAKVQDLSLNITKISGICGRLMCCLAYEDYLYHDAKKGLPKVNSRVNTKDGYGLVKAINVLKKEVTVEYENGVIKKLPASEISTGIFKGLKFRKEKKE